VAYDSPEAYDQTARAALAFACEENPDAGIDAEWRDDLTETQIRRKP
jgi:hypothetical protein